MTDKQTRPLKAEMVAALREAKAGSGRSLKEPMTDEQEILKLAMELAEAREQIARQEEDANFLIERLTKENETLIAQIAAIKETNQKQYDEGYAHGLSSRLGPSSEYVRELRSENEKLKAALERRGEIVFGREGD